jgi:hypothetical protein
LPHPNIKENERNIPTITTVSINQILGIFSLAINRTRTIRGAKIKNDGRNKLFA